MHHTAGCHYGYTPRSLTCNGRPMFPMMGEFHYSRYPRRHWQRELRKIRAGGIDILSSYVIWLHHEEEEGQLSFEGDLDLRRFVQAVADAGMTMFLRIGPWVHGEVRNGGFPDWLLQKDCVLRSNHPAYLAAVRLFFEGIFRQVDGLFHHQGGPIIGIQIENEYGHCGGLQGEEGEAHLRELVHMAEDIGYKAPYWTATGWGGALTGGLLPVMGGYPDAPWDPRTTEIEPSTNFVFSPQRNDHAIGHDLHSGGDLTFDPALYPYLTAELGGGLQVTAHRRPIATGRDIEAMSIAKMGSGASLLGYYMYHGGTNPVGRLSTFQESRSTGYPNDLPPLSYDFNAPLGEYGQPRDSYRRLRRLSLFLEDFGEALADMTVIFPPDNPEDPGNQSDLRHTQRSGSAGGYLFVNNYQRRRTMARHAGTVLKASTPGGDVSFPAADINDGDAFFWPFNLPVGSALLRRANATPLCLLRTGEGEVPVFYTDGDPAYDWVVPPESGRVLTLGRDDALQAARVHSPAGQHLMLFRGCCMEAEAGYLLEDSALPRFGVWPDLPACPPGFVREGEEGGFARYSAARPPATVTAGARADGPQRWKLTFTYSGDMVGALLELRGIYDTARLLVNGADVADSFYTGQPWEIDLERFGYPAEAELLLAPLKADAALYLEEWPALPGGTGCTLLSATARPIYSVPLVL